MVIKVPYTHMPIYIQFFKRGSTLFPIQLFLATDHQLDNICIAFALTTFIGSLDNALVEKVK